MRISKGICCVLLTILLGTFGLGGIQVQAAQKSNGLTSVSGSTISKGNLPSAGFEKAPSTKKEFYAELRKQMLKRPTQITIKYKGKVKDVFVDCTDMLMNVLTIDDKSTSDDADFLVGSVARMRYSATYSGNRAEFQFVIAYTESQNQVKKVNSKIKSELKKLNVSKMSDVGKVKAIHDYIVNLVDYDRTMTDHSTYGALVDSKHTTVCQGYALLMYKMLTEAGIESHYVTGYAGENHAWNVVKIDGKWYYIDATWDDPTGAVSVLSYNYFLVGTNTLKKDHKIDSAFAKLYPVAKNDYDWKKALNQSSNKADAKVNDKNTQEKNKNEKELLNRNLFISACLEVLDQELDYKNASDVERKLYDMYKNIFMCVIRDLPNKQYNLLVSGDDAFCKKYEKVCNEKIYKYIMDPCLEYMDSDEYANDVYNLLFEDYSEEEIETMSEKELEEITEVYAFVKANEKINRLSAKYTDRVIDECVKALKK